MEPEVVDVWVECSTEHLLRRLPNLFRGCLHWFYFSGPLSSFIHRHQKQPFSGFPQRGRKILEKTNVVPIFCPSAPFFATIETLVDVSSCCTIKSVLNGPKPL